MVMESVIKANETGWYIEITNTETNEIAHCSSVDEYMEKLQQMSEPYGTDMEVFWSSDADVHPMYMNEIREGMARYQEEHPEEGEAF